MRTLPTLPRAHNNALDVDEDSVHRRHALRRFIEVEEPDDGVEEREPQELVGGAREGVDPRVSREAGLEFSAQLRALCSSLRACLAPHHCRDAADGVQGEDGGQRRGGR
jgi:hypothetical protein